MSGYDIVQDLAIVLVIAAIVGFVFHRIGLSNIVGFLVAGLLVGPHASRFGLMTDPHAIEGLSQLGLAFLMFSIGLDLSISKMRRYGLGVAVAVVISAALVFNTFRFLTPLLGMTGREPIFIASMMVASSSAMIGKILRDAGLLHQRSGNLAMSISVLEDIVAVIVLTFVSSLANMNAGPEARPVTILGTLVAFITIVVILGLLLLPKALKLLARGGLDLVMLFITGLALEVGIIAVRTGYSLALGAFLLGAIIAETPQRPAIERAFEGMRDVFLAVFFVSIGLLIDPSVLLKNGLLIVCLGVGAVVVRSLAVTTGLILAGNPQSESLRAGLMAIPIGEFAFIIAQVGVSARLLPADFYPIAIGVATLTATVAPILSRNSDEISKRLLGFEPQFVTHLVASYRQFLSDAAEKQRRNEIISLAQRKLVPVVIGLTFASGLLIFANQLLRFWSRLFPRLSTELAHQLFWAFLGVLILIPVAVVWRSLQQFVGLVSSARAGDASRRAHPLVHISLQIVIAIALFGWLWVLAPVQKETLCFFGSALAVGISLAVFFRQRFERLQERIGTGLSEAILSQEERRKRTRRAWLSDYSDWELNLQEIKVPDSEKWFGRSIGELALRSRFGCSVVGVERQGYVLSSPGPETLLFPGDTLLALGSDNQLREMRRFFEKAEPRSKSVDLLEEIRMELVSVPDQSRASGQTLAALDMTRNFGVIIAGIGRAGQKNLAPNASQTIESGDWLLVIGTREKIRAFQEWIEPSPAATPQSQIADSDSR
ncbi:MAG TPA: cation:proton antiporter [Chthoniobacterales bacterium]|nr:cation:proton antiporter [Chthoniobacterales bacterium]